MGTARRTARLPVSAPLTVWRIAGSVAGVAVVLYGMFWLVVIILSAIVPPQKTHNLPIAGQCDRNARRNELTILTWNLGYAGTGAEADFFMDGGRGVLAKDRKTVLSHLSGITDTLHQHSSDIYFLQEVDSGSRRTYQVDEANVIETALRGYCSSHALNHDVPFIPYPYTAPLGRVRSGLLSLSLFMPSTAVRYQLPGSFLWPDSSFHLQRCLLAWRLPRDDGREWVLINLHLEAWDKGGIRKQELTFLRDLAIGEYQHGNYVVIGGDWNSVLPGVELDQFPTTGKRGAHTMKTPKDIFPQDWKWGVATSSPSSRRCNTAYRAGETYVTIIDGFLVSPNVQIDFVRGVPLKFRDSDHDPVEIRIHG